MTYEVQCPRCKRWTHNPRWCCWCFLVLEDQR